MENNKKVVALKPKCYDGDERVFYFNLFNNEEFENFWEWINILLDDDNSNFTFEAVED